MDECNEMSDDERDEILRRILRNKIGPTKDLEGVSAEEVVGIGELVMETKGLLMAKGFETPMEGARKQLVENALRMEAGVEENDEEDEDAENDIVARQKEAFERRFEAFKEKGRKLIDERVNAADNYQIRKLSTVTVSHCARTALAMLFRYQEFNEIAEF